MEKKLIAIRGRPDSGKTKAITLAHGELKAEGSCAYANPRYDATELKEIWVIEGVRVGFASAGDKPDRLKGTLRLLHENGCVVIVCAARLNRDGEPLHKTVEVVEQFCVDYGFDLGWIDKPRNRDGCDRANQAVADDIVAKVWAAIGSGVPMKA
jgi:hypothetical protein